MILLTDQGKCGLIKKYYIEEMFDTLIKQLKESEGITEQLKAENQMERVARMNNIRNRATEIINHNIIYN